MHPNQKEKLMQRILVVTFALASVPAAAQDLGGPLPGLTAEELAIWEAGRVAFEHDFTVEEGTGPFMNAQSCALCHFQPVLGGSEDGVANNVINFGAQNEGRFFELHELGGPILHRNSLASENVPGREDCDAPPKVVPAGIPDQVISLRHTPPLFGMGLIDALEDKAILELAGPKKNTPVVGAPNWGVELEGHNPFPATTLIRPRTVIGGGPRVGRFGWKSQNASLILFASEALQNELGVTTPFHDRENHPFGLGTDDLPEECKLATSQPNTNFETVILLHNFMALTAPPAPGPRTEAVRKGEKLFKKIGCQDCHVREHRTMKDYYTVFPGGVPHRVEALSNKKFFPWSDFLLHDLGDLNGDRRHQGRAAGNLFRTTPLWGIRHKTSFLHDGLAQTLDDAIAAHGGEAAESRDAYFALPEEKQDQVDAFIGHL